VLSVFILGHGLVMTHPNSQWTQFDHGEVALGVFLEACGDAIGVQP
jgi:hypothetical protein